jgi:hypothetical protein
VTRWTNQTEPPWTAWPRGLVWKWFFCLPCPGQPQPNSSMSFVDVHSDCTCMPFSCWQLVTVLLCRINVTLLLTSPTCKEVWKWPHIISWNDGGHKNWREKISAFWRYEMLDSSSMFSSWYLTEISESATMWIYVFFLCHSHTSESVPWLSEDNRFLDGFLASPISSSGTSNT